MDVDAYLERIGYRGTREPTSRTLRILHRAHLTAVPFENLDIPLGRPIDLTLPALFDKIVTRRRGGFCYELNGLFAWLAGELGFEVNRLAGRVFREGRPGMDRAHMLLLVTTTAGEALVTDVGFGDSFLEPVPLGDAVCEEPQPFGRAYRLSERDRDWVLARKAPGGDWEPQYQFSLDPREIGDFEAMCRFHQTSPDSPFTRRSVCSMATGTGRITLSGDSLIVTGHGHRVERPVSSPEEWLDLLREHFGIELGREPNAARLLHPDAASN